MRVKPVGFQNTWVNWIVYGGQTRMNLTHRTTGGQIMKVLVLRGGGGEDIVALLNGQEAVTIKVVTIKVVTIKDNLANINFIY